MNFIDSHVNFGILNSKLSDFSGSNHAISDKVCKYNPLAYSKKGCTPVLVLPAQHAYTKVHGKAGKRTIH